MKLFQRLLVAPAALGLMAPLAANADISPVSSESDLSSEIIQARVDGVEAQLGEVMAGQFSSSTKMSGKAAFITGYVDDDSESDTDSITMEYMYQLNLNTSFTGEDNLYTRIKTGNVSDHFGDSGQGTYLSAANKNGGTLKVDKLWYQFPVGDSLQVWVGPRIENYYMLASSASIYKPITKQFANGPNGSSYGSSTSPGFGVAWTQEVDDPSAARWAVSANYTAKDGADSSSDNGLFGEKTRNFVLTKIEYGSPQWQVSLATSFKENGANGYDGYYHSKLADHDGDITAYGLRGYWKPDETGAIPEIQVGYETASMDSPSAGQAEDTSGWMIGLGWKDLFVDGNRAGVAFGSRQAATGIKGGGSDPSEDNTVWEAYYEFKINDGVTVTPAVFGSTDVEAEGKDITGAVLLTEFRF
jgi:hypothetical protein